jgi:FdhD protein
MQMLGAAEVEIERVKGNVFSMADDSVALEEPMELQIEYGAENHRARKSIAVTMRTPGNDQELAAGFLWTEGVIDDTDAIDEVMTKNAVISEPEEGATIDATRTAVLPKNASGNLVIVRLHPDTRARLANLERNFYTTSSCGVCGKASLAALRVLSPPRSHDEFRLRSSVLSALLGQLRDAQPIFSVTGGLHGAAIVNADGELVLTREDVGRHNAVDKLVGYGLISGTLPFRDKCLLLSGRASFELMQKAVMAGIPFVAAAGAPSSLAITVAKAFGITLVGFLRDGGFNIYSGFERLSDRTRT